MTTYKQREMFVERVISTSLLNDAVDWIAEQLSPEDVFSVEQLSEWALDNEFT